MSDYAMDDAYYKEDHLHRKSTSSNNSNSNNNINKINNNNSNQKKMNRNQSTLETLLGSASPYRTTTTTTMINSGKAGLEFEDLSYSVMKKLTKDGKSVATQVNLLQGISGQALEGNLTAVLGPSGAGKSTFLDAIAGRIAKGSLKGRVRVDGRTVTTSMMKRISSYVMQDDQLFPMLTVYETFIFAAEVRLPASHYSRQDKQNRVHQLIKQLGLEAAAHTYIGNEGVRGVSGGERRRVSIGVDIIHGPSLLFLDEPTSGLDSTSAHVVIERLREIAELGSTVILTIHQPSFRIQQLLNRLIILARGKLIYLGNPDSLQNYLAAFGRPVPEGESSLEYLLDVIKEYDGSDMGVEPLVQFQRDGTAPDPGKTPIPKTPIYQIPGYDDYTLSIEEGNFDRSLPKRMRTPFNNDPKLASHFYKEFPAWLYNEALETIKPTPRRSTGITQRNSVSQEIPQTWKTPTTDDGMPQYSDYTINTPDEEDYQQEEEEEEEEYDDDGVSNSRGKYANGWWREVAVLMWRNYRNIMRTPELFLSREMVILVMSAMLASLFKKPQKSLDGVNELLNFYIFGVCLLFFSSNDAVPTFIQERFIFIRESSHNAYRASTYVIANLIINLPFLALQALTFVLITYWSLHLDAHFLLLWFILFSALITTNSFVIFISAIVPNYIMGYAAVIAITALFFLNCGFLLKRTDIPPGWIFMHYISTMKYPFEALLKNHFGDGIAGKPPVCYAYGQVFETPGPLGKVSTTSRADNCSVQGSDVLKSMGMGHVHIWLDILAMLGWGIFYRLFFYVVIRFYSNNQRK